MAELRTHSRGYRIRVWALLLEKVRIKMPLHGPGVEFDRASKNSGIERSMPGRRIWQQQFSGGEGTFQNAPEHGVGGAKPEFADERDRKSTRLNSSHMSISYA